MTEHVRQTVAAGIAGRLRADLPSFAGPYLPPMRTLCARYGVSMTTMSKAVGILAEQGVFEVFARKRVRLAGQNPGPKPSPRPADRLYRRLVDDISSGRIPTGGTLPKISFLAARFGLSNHTVRRTYGFLEGEGRVHRHGRRFVVGPAQSAAARPRRGAPTVLVMSPSVSSWEGLCTSKRTAPFGTSFVGEAERAGVRLVHVATAAEFDTVWPELYRKAAALGGRYIGAILSGTRRELEPGPETWIHALSGLGMPVVWFDRNEEGLTDPKQSPRAFSRCHCSERSAARACLDHLFASGHRDAAFVYMDETPWSSRRLSLLRAEADNPEARVRLASWSGARPIGHWRSPGKSGILSDLERLHRSGLPVVRQAIDALLSQDLHRLNRRRGRREEPAIDSRYDPIVSLTRDHLTNKEAGARVPHSLGIVWSGLALAPLLDYPDTTCLIAPNDAIARQFHLKWLKDQALTEPEKMSIISFDNSARFSFFPLTSVDFGFAALGYKAFHLLQGDIPIPRTRDGSVAAEACVVDRGTVQDRHLS